MRTRPSVVGRMRAKHAKNAPESIDDLLALLDWLPASVALWDPDVRLRYGNHRSLTRFGRPYEQLMGARLSDLVQAHAVEMSAQYINGALAGQPQQVERAMVDREGQRYNAHQVSHIPNVVGETNYGYCALAVDITASIEGYEQARRAREREARKAVRERIAGDIENQHLIDDLSTALERLDDALERAVDAVPSLSTAADAIDHTIDELRATVPASMLGAPYGDPVPIAFPSMPMPIDVGIVVTADLRPRGVRWPPDITGRGWSADDAYALLDLLPAEIAVWDLSLRNVFANRAAVRWFGRADRAEVIGEHARDLLGAEVFEAANVAYAETALRGQPQQFDRTVRYPAGLRHLQVYFAPRWRGDKVDGIYSFVVDVTHRVEAELALQDARAELASARERERIADHLHNLVIQRLFAAGLAATMADAEKPDAHVRSVQDGIVAALEDLEAAITTLHERVAVLDLLPDLAHLVHDAVEPHGIAVSIENVGSVEYVPPEIGTELLAVAEAALANVVQHAAASAVVVTIAADRAEVWLRIADDGIGVGTDPQGKGMADMASRAARLNGTCIWTPNDPGGTVVDFRVPMPR